jgi:hypothetical protein
VPGAPALQPSETNATIVAAISKIRIQTSYLAFTASPA